MHQPMQVYPGKQLTVSQIKTVRESQERAKADAAALGDDSLVVDPNLKDFSNVSEDNGNDPVFLLHCGKPAPSSSASRGWTTLTPAAAGFRWT